MTEAIQTSIEAYRTIKRDILTESNITTFEQPGSVIATLKSCVSILGCSATMGDVSTFSQLFRGQRRFRTSSRTLCCYHRDNEQSLVESESISGSFQGDHE